MKAVYFILNSFDTDSRARLEVETIRSMGIDVEIIATERGNSDNFMGCPIHRVAQRRWPKQYRFVQYNLTAAAIASRLNADFFHAVDLDSLYAAHRAGSGTKGRLIYEARELYAELEALRGRPVVKAFWKELEKRLIRNADYVFTINESIAGELAARYDIDRPGVIRNVSSRGGSSSPVDLHEEFEIPANHRIIIYQGVLRRGQGLAYLLSLVRRIENVTLALFGEGPIRDELNRLAMEYEIMDRVRFAGAIPPDMLLNYTAGGDLGALLMEDTALNNRLALPQKLFQYLSAGIPQAVSPMPEIAGFVEKEKTGIVVPLNNPENAAASITTFLSDDESRNEIRQNCRKSALANNWEIESEALKHIYRRLGAA